MPPDQFELRVCRRDIKPSMTDRFNRDNPNFEFGFCSICGRYEMTITEHMPQYAIEALTAPKNPIRQDLWAQQRVQRMDNLYRAFGDDDA